VIDTGVKFDHPALVNSYRGNLGGGIFEHNYNWFDFVNNIPVPHDNNGHGTMGIGFVSGDDGVEYQIGVAPDADWIAVKACGDGGACDLAALHAAFQWMLAPTDLNGQNANPSKAPNIVLGMWGGSQCYDFQGDLMVLRAANILPVFSPGAGGPSCLTIGAPASLSEALAAGATDNTDLIASFSARGPSPCTGEIKPDLSAPGVNVRTSTIGDEYVVTSGTSWSAAHTAGAAALVISADPLLAVNDVEEILFSTALCIDDSQCGGSTCPDPNNVYGYGRIDAYEAVSATQVTIPPVDLPWLSEDPISGTLGVGEGVGVEVTFDATGLEAGGYQGALGITSTDPDTPFASIPVTLEVVSLPQPIISIEPLSFSAILPEGGVQTDTLTIRNDGDALLTFTLYEISTAHQLMSPPVELTIPDRFPADSQVQVDEEVMIRLSEQARARLVLYLRGEINFSGANPFTGKDARGWYVYNQLLETAAQSADLYNWLLFQGAQPRRLLTANAIAATLDIALLEKVLNFPQVGRVGVNRTIIALPDEARMVNKLPSSLWDLLSLPAGPLAVEWNIARIRADEAWATFGVTGGRATVGIIDTGVVYTHPALVNQYRGNLEDGNFNHNYNWYDVVYGQPAPYDGNGHGTFGAGIAVGDDGQGNQIGVAPGAKWIAIKAMDDGGGTTEEYLHAALQWIIAPTDLTGNNPDPSKAPDVALNMWRWYACTGSFDLDLAALRAANILPVFAPGHDGPGCSMVVYPAANPNTIAAGATDQNDVISTISGHGPSCVDNSIKPDVVAPGVDIRSSTNDGDYAVWSGTSFSTAHLAGAAALLFSADPAIDIDTLEGTLFSTAVCHAADYACPGDGICPKPNNTYGYGRIDVFEAVSTTLGTAFDVPWLTAGPLAVVLPPGNNFNASVIINATGMEPGTYQAGIAIESNDPSAPYTTLPVSLSVYEPCEPISNITVSFTPTDPLVGETITFTASAEGTQPISYTWRFEDGSYDNGKKVTYIFNSAGVHVVSLHIENACDNVDLEIQLVVQAVIRRILMPLIIR
jgi:subtilisin family serine protease